MAECVEFSHLAAATSPEFFTTTVLLGRTGVRSRGHKTTEILLHTSLINQASNIMNNRIKREKL